MMDYNFSEWPVRQDIEAAHQRTWSRLARAGSWWTGRERVAIAAASRTSEKCDICEANAAALSPSSSFADHAQTRDGTGLDREVISVVHRVRQDASRLTRTTVERIVRDVMSDGAYVELVGIVASVTAVDAFADALGLARWALPDPVAGKPDAYRPSGLTDELAWVPVIDPAQVSGREADIYARQSAANIHRALTLVPAEKTGFFDLDDAMYLPDAQLRDFANEYRAIDHRQIELLAARVSALNQCHY